MNQQVNYWHDEMSEETARRVLGTSHFDLAIEQGAGFCASRAMGQWQANAQEAYGAYRTAERIAKAKKTAVLSAFDDLQHESNRNLREQTAEVRRKARSAL